MRHSWVNAGVLSMLIVVVGSFPLARTPRQASVPASLVAQQLAGLACGSPLVVDGDNVRGKAAFAWSQTELLERLQQVISTQGLGPGVRTQLHFDHGAQCDAFPVGFSEEEPICVVFSGPQASADDTICRDVKWWARFLSSEDSVKHADDSDITASAKSLPQVIIVVTDDSELRNRCRRNIKENGVLVRFISSRTFVGFLKAHESEDISPGQDGLSCNDWGDEASIKNAKSSMSTTSFDSSSSCATDANNGVANAAVETAIEAVQQEQYWRRELRKARQQLKHGCSRKQRTKLEKTLRNLEARVASFQTIGQEALGLPETAKSNDAKGLGVSLLEGVMASALAPSRSGPGNSEEESVAMAVIEGLQRAGRARAKKRTNSEHTWERVVAAEKFRSHLSAAVTSPSSSADWLQLYAEFHRS